MDLTSHKSFDYVPAKYSFTGSLEEGSSSPKITMEQDTISDLICTVSLCQAIDTLIGKRVITSFLSKYNKSSMTRRISDTIIVYLSIYLSI
jgi:hypothetical protein